MLALGSGCGERCVHGGCGRVCGVAGSPCRAEAMSACRGAVAGTDVWDSSRDMTVCVLAERVGVCRIGGVTVIAEGRGTICGAT